MQADAGRGMVPGKRRAGMGGHSRWEADGWVALLRRTGKAVSIGRRRDMGTVTKLLVKGGGEGKGRDKKRGGKPACQG